MKFKPRGVNFARWTCLWIWSQWLQVQYEQDKMSGQLS